MLYHAKKTHKFCTDCHSQAMWASIRQHRPLASASLCAPAMHSPVFMYKHTRVLSDGHLTEETAANPAPFSHPVMCSHSKYHSFPLFFYLSFGVSLFPKQRYAHIRELPQRPQASFTRAGVSCFFI